MSNIFSYIFNFYYFDVVYIFITNHSYLCIINNLYEDTLLNDLYWIHIKGLY